MEVEMQNSKENLDLSCCFSCKYKFQLDCLAFKDLNHMKFTIKKKKLESIPDGKGSSF